METGLRKVFLGLALSISACSLDADLLDISKVQMEFISPSKNTFTNKNFFDFKVQLNTSNNRILLSNAKMEIYKDEGCQSDKLVKVLYLNGDNQGSSSFVLKDGKIFSARVVVSHRENTFRSACSPWVGADFQTPESVSVKYPNGNTYVNSKQFLAAWSSSVDNGISGLRDDPYRLRLYGQPFCSGPVLQTAESKTEQYIFKNLTHGAVYSVQVSAVDKAGNESSLACSPYTEIDIFAPGFHLQDPTSIEGYSRTISPQIEIDNDAEAAFWCLTPDLAFIPNAHTENCPGGVGSANGWYTSRPAVLPVAVGDGLKIYNLWVFRANGSLISNKQNSAAIRLDQTPPGAFNIAGVGNSEDVVFDRWLTSLGQLEVRWMSSTDAADYSIEVRNSNNDLVCAKEGIPSSSTSHIFALGECATLTNNEAYQVRITSFDIARNQTNSVISFQVDLLPPEPFVITGISGGTDYSLDNLFGVGSPTLHFEDALGSTYYEVEVKDIGGITACTLGFKNSPTTYFDYATESGVACVLIDGGTYRAFVTALDDGKNRTPATNSGFLFYVDTQIPSLNFESGPDLITSDTSALISFRAEDTHSGLQEILCSLDGAMEAPCISPISLNSLAEGAHNLAVTAKDIAGNSVTQNYSWYIDLSGPVTSIHTGPLGSQASDTGLFTFSAIEVGVAGIDKYECSLDTSAFADCSSPISYSSISEGPHFFKVRSTDTLGNIGAEVSRSFLTDYTSPSLAITSSPANPTHHQTAAVISFSSSDSGSGLVSTRCRIDSAAFVGCTSPVTYSGLSPGNHLVTIEVADAVGHTAAATHSWTLYTYSWNVGSFGGCSAYPTWSGWSGWSGCTASCGGGTQWRSRTCYGTSGAQNRSVTCRRYDGVIVGDAYCLGTKPTTSQGCSAYCSGASSESQSCNTQACNSAGY